MAFSRDDVRFLLDQLESEANGQSVDQDMIREEAERLMVIYPGMSGLLAPIAERHSRRVA